MYGLCTRSSYICVYWGACLPCLSAPSCACGLVLSCYVQLSLLAGFVDARHAPQPGSCTLLQAWVVPCLLNHKVIEAVR